MSGSRIDRGRVLAALFLFLLIGAPAGFAGTIVTIPGAAHGAGLNGTVWRSDVWIFNSGEETADVGYLVFATGESTCARPTVLPPTIPVPPGATVRLFDPLESGPAQGWIELDLPAGVHARARTFDAAPAGTYGQSVPVLRKDDFAPAGSRAVLAGMIRSSAFRTNLFIVSTSASCEAGNSFEATVTLRGPGGEVVGEAPVSVPSWGQSFVRDPFGNFGSGDCTGCRIDVIAPWPIYPFASVIDNRTGDPTFVSPDF